MLTLTESFAFDVVSKLSGIQKSVLEDAAENRLGALPIGIDPVVIFELVELVGQIVLYLIDNCPNKMNPEALYDTVSKPSFMDRFRVRAVCYSVCRQSKDRRFLPYADKIADSLITAGASVPKDQILALLSETAQIEHTL